MDEFDRLNRVIEALRQQLYHHQTNIEIEIKSYKRNGNIFEYRIKYDLIVVGDRLKRIEAKQDSIRAYVQTLERRYRVIIWLLRIAIGIILLLLSLSLLV